MIFLKQYIDLSYLGSKNYQNFNNINMYHYFLELYIYLLTFKRFITGFYRFLCGFYTCFVNF